MNRSTSLGRQIAPLGSSLARVRLPGRKRGSWPNYRRTKWNSQDVVFCRTRSFMFAA